MAVIPLEHLDHPTFAALQGQIFHLAASDGSIPLTLTAVIRGGTRHPDATRDPFSLIFTGAPDLRIPQGIRSLTHETLDTLEIFLTQVGATARGSEFEAIFS